MSVIEDAIKKYGGEDEAYKLKLKEGIRGAMGYSNWVSKLSRETAAPASIGDVSGLSPNGINARISNRFGMQDQNVNTIQAAAGAIDTTAGSLADAQAAREKAARGNGKTAMGFENGVAFSPKTQIEQEILKYMQNPRNPDGSVKSLQQFEAEMNDTFKGIPGADKPYETPTGVVPREALDASQIKAAIEARVPKDFIGNEDKYFLMAQGYSAKQAEENAGALKRGQMSPEEQHAWDVAHPAMASVMTQAGNDPSVITDVGVVSDENGNIVPKYSFSELTARHPGVDPKVLSSLAKPVYAASVSADVFSNLPGAGDLKQLFDSGKVTPSDYASFIGSEEYKNFKTALIPMYGGLYTDKEIDQIIFDSIIKK